MTDSPSFLPGFRNTLPEAPAEKEKPGFLDILPSAFQRENAAVALVQNSQRQEERDAATPETGPRHTQLTVSNPDFDPFETIIDTEYQEYSKLFVEADSPEEVAVVKSQIDKSIALQEHIGSASGTDAFLASLVAGVSSPETFIPVGGSAIRGLRLGSSVGRNALNTGIAGAVGATISEIALQTDETRTLEESVINVLGGAAFGGVLGGGVGAVTRGNGTVKRPYNAMYKDEAWDGIKIDPNKLMDHGSSSVGAAQTPKLPIEMERMASSFGLAEKTAWLGPQMRVLVKSGSASAMRAMNDLAENAFVFEKNNHGIATTPGGTVETAGKRIMGEVVGVEDKISDLFSQYRIGEAQSFRGNLKLAAEDIKGPRQGKFKRHEFAEQLKFALEDGRHEVPEIQEAATQMRTHMDMLAKEAESLGMIQPGLVGKRQANGKFYAPVVYQRGAIRAKRRTAAGDGFEDRISQHFHKSAGKMQERITKLEKERDILEAAAEEQRADLPDDQQLSKIRRFGRQEPQKFPVLDLIRSMGGVKPDSVLAGELRAMGVTSRSHVGIFRKNTGISDVDNFVQSEHDIFQDLPIADDSGLLGRDVVLDLISDEVGGNPIVPRATDADAENFKALFDQMVEQGVDFSKSNRNVRNQLLSNKVDSAEAPDIENAANRGPSGNQLDDPEYQRSLDQQNAGFGSDSAKRLLEIDEIIADLQRYADAADPAIARTLATETTDKILGMTDADLYRPPEPGSRGFLKERLINIDPALIRDFTQNNALAINRRYSRVMATDIAMHKKFGDVEMTRQLDDIKTDFATRRADLVKRSVIDLIRPGGKENKGALADLRSTPEGQKIVNSLVKGVDTIDDIPTEDIAKIINESPSLEKAMADLGKQEQDTLRDLRVVRDRIRGQFDVPEDPHSIWNRVERGLLGLNYMRLLGGMVISAFPDAAMGIFRNGLQRNIKVHMRLMSSAATYKGSKKEMQLLGVGTEMAMDSRLSALTEYEIGEGAAGKFGRAAETAVRSFGKVTLMTPWNAAMKQMNGVVFSNFVVDAARQIAAGKGTKKQIRELASWNIDEQLAKEIVSQMEKHSPDYDNTLMLGLGEWSNARAAEEFRNALITQVDKTILTPGQEKPIWMSRRVARLAGQFKSFAFSATQMIMISGMQRRGAEQLSGIMALIAMGTITYAVKEKQAGRDLPPVDIEHSGEWLKNGIDRSGVTGILFDFNNMAEKITDHSIGVSRLTGGAPVSRYRSRNKLGAILGPSAGTVEDIMRLTGDAASGDWTESSTARMRRLAPFQNAIGIRKLFDEFERGFNAATGVPEKKDKTKK